MDNIKPTHITNGANLVHAQLLDKILIRLNTIAVIDTTIEEFELRIMLMGESGLSCIIGGLEKSPPLGMRRQLSKCGG